MTQPQVQVDFSNVSRYVHSEQMFARAKALIPGGVNSPVRAFNAVGGTPLFIAGADGAVMQDMDGHQYVDFVGSWGPMLLGHANKKVIEAITTTAQLGTSFGAPTDRETYLADLICDRHPHVEMVRLVNSGTEATMSAIRLARGFMGKERLIKCDGHYHGHGDSLLVAAGSGAASAGIPGSAGVPKALAELTTVVPWNDLAAMEAVFKTYNDIAAVIIEPIAGNMGCVPPAEGYLSALRKLCTDHGALLILDEVMTGFRVHKGSAQTLYGIKPDIACFGKIIGGGLPLAAYGGRKDVMEKLAPLGPVYQAGTLSGNPLAVAAGAATVEQLTDDVYKQVDATTLHLIRELQKLTAKHNIPAAYTGVCGMFSIFFADKAPVNFAEVKKTDTERFKKFFHGMLEQGVYLAPSPFEACFVSAAHSAELVDHTLRAADSVLRGL
jgi:glutamate-1-semialdehyde 2,1-aminomutase